LCFYRSTFGFQTKLKIPWLEIIDISNKDTSKIMIRYNKKEDGKVEKEELVFSGFTSRDQSSKYITKLWQRAKGIDSESESGTSGTDDLKKKGPQAPVEKISVLEKTKPDPPAAVVKDLADRRLSIVPVVTV
jgi:hypothetical protein